ncbi:MAG: penicillin-binding protein 2 [Candidatus Zambryskibacteria bacterium]|nr:penicillin-binding protein 2 [Candidatus Zambryskibacteria bacterium]
MKFNYLRRIRIISISVFGFALILIGRLYILQVVHSGLYKDKADRQYVSTAKGIFDRGVIFFQNKDGTLVSAATLESGFTVTVNPQVLKEPETVYQKLNEIIPVAHDAFIAKAVKKNDSYEEVAQRVDTETGQKIDALNIPGLKVYKERWRFYPGGSSAAHIIGILGYKGDDFAGRYGLERQFEPMLKRTEGAYTNFFAQIFSDIKSGVSKTSSVEADVVTTIEPTTQSFLEGLLASTTEKWKSDMTGGIIINPKTGEILAMETYPTFDPNNFQKEKSVSIFGNPLVENVYELGSIIKPLTISAGIDTGVITATSTFYDKGYVVVNNKKISDFDEKERGMVSMQDVLSQSLNVGAAHVQSLLGNIRFTDYMYAFGLNEKTGIELPNEARNLVDNLKSSRDIEHATASFGQGIALTPISAVRALSAVANGGMLVEPHIVKKINYKLGFSTDTATNNSRVVLKRETTDEVSRMLTYSVDHVLAGGTLRIPNYSIAAKTGTAQIPNLQSGGYYTDRFLHSFIGYFPSYDPKFFIFLYMVNPHGARYGSETLTAPFMEMVKFLINYYEVAPDR